MPGFVMNETMNPPSCPSLAELRAFAVGNLRDADIGRIADHVLGCEACDRALGPLDGLTDGLLRNLEGFNNPDGPPPTPVPEALLRVARSAGPSGRESCPDVSLDSGRRFARMLGEGACRLGR